MRMKWRRCWGNRSWKIYPVRGEYARCGGPRSSLIKQSCFIRWPHSDGIKSRRALYEDAVGDFFAGAGRRLTSREKTITEKNRLADCGFRAQRRKTFACRKLRRRTFAALGYSGLRPKRAPPEPQRHYGFRDLRGIRRWRKAIHLVGHGVAGD